MHFVFLTIPSSGEFNVQLATAQELLLCGHRVTFLSGGSFRKHLERFRSKQSVKHQQMVEHISLGSQKSVEDFTPTVQERIHEMRKTPGDLTSINTCIEIAMVSPEEHMSTATLVRDILTEIRPDMIVVDILSPAMITGVRLSGRRFVLTIPCSPGMTALPTYFEPHCVASNRRGSWSTLIENTILKTKELIYFSTRSDMRDKRALITDSLKLKSFGMAHDLALVPPYWDDPNCVGGVHFNTFALTDCAQQSPKIVFVGAGVSEEPNSSVQSAELQWLDEALVHDESVVYVNMGSMFIWTQQDFEACMEALQDVYDMMHGKIRFLFKINRPLEPAHGFSAATPVPSFVRLTHWIESQQGIYRHPSLKAFVHHGGGNSFNEAVYFGVPQLVLSQWLDTHEYGSLAEQYGLGLRSSRPPHIETTDLRQQLLRLLGPEWAKFKSNASVWALRSKLGGGPAAAAKMLEVYADNVKNEAAHATKKTEMISSYTVAPAAFAAVSV